MAPLTLSGAPIPVGLDIGGDFIRAAWVKPSGAGPTLATYGSVPTPPGAVVEGEIVDPICASMAIRDLWKQAGFKIKDAAIGVSNQKVVVRLVDLPFMQRDELARAIRFQAQDYIPIPIEEAILDFQILGDYVTPADEHMMEVLLVAAQREMISTAVAAVEGAGLRPVQVDVTAFALVRALLGTQASWFSDEVDDASEGLSIVDIGSGLTTIVIVERGIPRFTRVSALAGNQFTQAVANVLNISFPDAEDLKNRAGLPRMDGSVDVSPEEETGAFRAARDALEREANKFVAEVRRSLDYYLAQTTQVRSIRRVYLTGPGAGMQNLAEFLSGGLQTEVVLGDPLAQVEMGSGVGPEVLAERMGCGPAIGLALGSVY